MPLLLGTVRFAQKHECSWYKKKKRRSHSLLTHSHSTLVILVWLSFLCFGIFLSVSTLSISLLHYDVRDSGNHFVWNETRITGEQVETVEFRISCTTWLLARTSHSYCAFLSDIRRALAKCNKRRKVNEQLWRETYKKVKSTQEEQ